MPRYVKSCSALPGHKVEFIDAASFLSMHDEIMVKEIYRFGSPNNPVSYIIDCGANIGLSILYFKQLFPEAKILAFEPDSEIFKILNQNIKIWQLKNIDLREAAVWKNTEPLYFVPDGADGGRICDSPGEVKVPAVRLRDYLECSVDFLKIDIEGAESDVLIDCADRLCNVQNLFVEYHSFTNRQQNLDVILAILKRAGFRYQTQTVFSSAKPFMQTSTHSGMDLQVNIFAYRIKS